MYVLKSLKNGKLYIGSTQDLKNRLKEHNTGRGGLYTSQNVPFELIYYEAYKNISDARNSEKFFKTGYGREVLKDKIKIFLTES